ncbi:unnamed protein product [Brassica oleracea var. botrytis]|uniref:(rape) hypothetical protein n=1 Tax=Brassica napus TaxID=3708 RepID=A0A816LR05_BRANA|nr:unnamed protein product [Brassica napus]
MPKWFTWWAVTDDRPFLNISYTNDIYVVYIVPFGWNIHSETHDLCSETTCPVETGDFLVAHSQVLETFLFGFWCLLILHVCYL